MFGNAFPKTLGDDVAIVEAILPPAVHGSVGGFSADVSGEPLLIPDRIYHPELDALPQTLLQTTIAHCIYTRHSDGFVRQRHLSRLFATNQSWVVPFVLHLIGECAPTIRASE